ncbi:FAD/NAD(P)-binding domain-containing protein [Auricularia subglabra TFB-10046 SS5]|nr:FAD/NAD(P)-binding domain-containing protein [Auricularia subglabra TFB-10046 SS5]
MAEAEGWLSSFAQLCSGGLGSEDTADSDLLDVFVADDDSCWLRDLLVLSPDFTSLHGHAAIRAHLRCAQALRGFRLDSAHEFEPGSRVLLFRFEIANTPIAHPGLGATGRGCARLTRQAGAGWRAWAVLLVLHNFVGHEEDVGRARLGVGQVWDDAWEAAQASAHEDLGALVVGAGHNGLMIAARLKQMGVKALVIERTVVGGGWKHRYSSLKLHTPLLMNSFPYHTWPTTWPKYLPKSKMASFQRSYAEAQELQVWEHTELLSDPLPVYDDGAGTWTVHVRREDGKAVELHPRHIVLAMGLVTSPKRLDIPGQEDFGGTVLHSSQHTDGKAWKGKKVVVVGACNSGADIALDAVRAEAAEVTMVQRSKTTVLSMSAIESVMFDPLYPDSSPLSVAQHDLINNSMPHPAVIRMLRGGVFARAQERDRALLDGLSKAGFETSDTPLYELLLGRNGGYIMDQGAVPYLISGRIGVKHGVEVARLEPRAVVFTDGSRLEADVLVLAIGYEPMRAAVRRVFGSDVVDQTTRVWGLDDKGEIRGVYRPSGHKALWYAGGDFSHSRFMGRLLALQILDAELGRKHAATAVV